MKILYILNATTVTGGATKSFLSMIDEIQKYGHEVLVVCPNTKGVYKILKDKNIKVFSLRYKMASLPNNKGIVNKFKWIFRFVKIEIINHVASGRLIKLLHEYKIDIIHDNTSVTDLGYRVAKKLNLPNVIHIREYGDLDFNLRLYNLKKRISNKNSYTIPITKDIRRHHHLESDSHCCQIYNGIIHESDIRFTAKKIPFILYAGRIEPTKGLKDLLEAYVHYCKHNNTKEVIFKLKIAGVCSDVKFLESLKDFVKSYDLEDWVEWLGERADINELYYNAFLTIIPSKFEGLGRVFPEAISNGCICIVRNTGGLKEQLQIGKEYTGQHIAYDFENWQELTNILSELANKNIKHNDLVLCPEYVNLVYKSQQSVREFFTIETFGKRLNDFYLKIKLNHQKTK